MAVASIHIPKNGGMTIRHCPQLKSRVQVISPDLHKNAEYTAELHKKMRETGDHHGNEHARWRDVKLEARVSMKFFAITRNPWDRVVSRFLFAKKVIEVENKVPRCYAKISSFPAFLEERHKWGTEPFMWHRAIRGWYPQLDYVADEAGEIQCDLLRLEHLDYDLSRYFGRRLRPRRRNVTALLKGRYQELYDNSTKRIVGEWYEKDIETFGFTFDSTATKNVVFS